MTASLLALLMNPGVDHAIYAAAGIIGTWWAMRHPGAGVPAVKPVPATPVLVPKLADVVPARHVGAFQQLLASPGLSSIMDIVQLLLNRLDQQSVLAAHGALQILSQPIAAPGATLPVPVATSPTIVVAKAA